MNEPEVAAIREAAVATRKMAAHLSRLRNVITADGLVDVARASGSDAEVERLHAFSRMFEQLYDVTARQLFRGLLLLLREDFRALAFKEVVRRLERLERLSDGDRWITLGETRNKLVHDYAATPAQFADHVNRATVDLNDLLHMHRETLAHIQAEGIDI